MSGENNNKEKRDAHFNWLATAGASKKAYWIGLGILALMYLILFLPALIKRFW